MTTRKTIALTRWTFVDKVVILLFNMLSRLVITFLPRSKYLLISLLQSPSAVILERQKIKSATVSTVSPSICHEVVGPYAMILVFWMFIHPQCVSANPRLTIHLFPPQPPPWQGPYFKSTIQQCNKLFLILVSFLQKGEIDIFTFLKFSHLELVLCLSLALLFLISHLQQPNLSTVIILTLLLGTMFQKAHKIYKAPLTVIRACFKPKSWPWGRKLISEACEISLSPHSSDGLGGFHMQTKLLDMEAERLDLLWKRWSQLCCENQPEGDISTLSW